MATIPEFFLSLGDGNFEVLEEIIRDKYFKFITTYWLLKKYEEEITSVSYKQTKKEKLKLQVEFSEKANAKKIRDEMKEKVKEDDLETIVSLKLSGKTLSIEITRNEDEEILQ